MTQNPAPPMQEFLEGLDDYKAISRGEIVDGVVMRVASDGVLVDVNSKSEGFIPAREMQSLGLEGLAKLKVGDEVVALVLIDLEGQVLLSLDKARGEKGWRVLQRNFEKGETFEAPVEGYNRGGLLVNFEGVSGFIPVSQVASVRLERADENADNPSMAKMVGQPLKLKVIEINRRRNRLILSERAALQDWREQQKSRLMEELKEGELRRGKVTGIRNFGAFVDLGGADGLIPLSELSWERVASPQDMLRVGQEVEVFVMKVDPESKRIALSLRRARPESWDQIVGKYAIGQLVAATITKLATFGAFARVQDSVEGLIHVSELSDRRIGHPKEVVKEGDVVTVKILRIEPERRRLALSLKQAREEAEGISELGEPPQ